MIYDFRFVNDIKNQKSMLKGQVDGFSVIELIVVIAISLIVLSASIPIYGNLQGSSQLNDMASGLVQDIRIARERSINRLNNSSHGIYFDIDPGGDDNYILYQGDSYATRNSLYDKIIKLDSVMTLSTNISNNEINFSKSFGLPSNIGTIIVTHAVNGDKVMTLNSFGRIDLD